MFQDDDLLPVITSITVKASAKAWAGAMEVVVGESSETEFSLTSTPTKPGRAWTMDQARQVSLTLRMELQRLLLVDARCLDRRDPNCGHQSLVNYEAAIAQVRGEEPSPVETEDDNGRS